MASTLHEPPVPAVWPPWHHTAGSHRKRLFRRVYAFVQDSEVASLDGAKIAIRLFPCLDAGCAPAALVEAIDDGRAPGPLLPNRNERRTRWMFVDKPRW